MQQGESVVERIRKDCWDKALFAFGTAWIFEQRASKLKRRLSVLTFLGIVVPAAIGLLYMSSVGVLLKQSFTMILWFALLVGLFQLIGTLWGLVAGWGESYSYAVKSIDSNTRFRFKYEALARHAPPELEPRFWALLDQDTDRTISDELAGITDQEKRAGMRIALFHYQRKCAGCHRVPKSTEPTRCGVCGDFPSSKGVKPWIRKQLGF